MSKSTNPFVFPTRTAANGPPPSPAVNAQRRTATTASYLRSQDASPAEAPSAPEPPSSEPLSQHQIELVQQSWAKVMPISDAAATLFYGRLFELDPSLRALFKSDIGEQKKKLMQTLAVAVDGLRNPDKLIPVLKALGERHVGYMVVEHHYDHVGEALLWTLREGLGDGFTPDVEEAWTAVYGLVAGVMKDAARHAVAPHHAEASRPVSRIPPRPRSFMLPADLSQGETHAAPESAPLGAQTLVGFPRTDGATDHEARLAYAANGASHGEIDDGAATLSFTSPRDSSRAPAGSPPPAASFVVPITGHDMTFHVQVKVEYPAPLPAPAGEPRAASTSTTLDAGALLALFCVASSMGATLLLGLGSRGAEGLSPPTLYGVPLLVMVLVFGSFCFGYVSRRSRAPQR